MNTTPLSFSATSPLLSLTHNAMTWVEISKSAIEHNITTYKNIVGNNVSLAVVIKSNAYGHGIVNVAMIAEHHPHVAYICVVNVSEALLLRAHNIKKPILVLSYIDASIEEALLNNIELAVFDMATANKINDTARQLGIKATVHLKVDTGLSRLGLRDEQALEFILSVKQLSHTMIHGIFTHLATSEHKDQQYVLHQLDNFNLLINSLEQQGINIPYKHSSCSAALLSAPQTHYNFARLGIGTYGLWPSAENKTLAQLSKLDVQLKPALTWKTRIIHIKHIPADSTIGYDRTYQTNRPTKLAVIPVGYYEGYDRKLSNRSVVMINNRIARIVGRIAMNLTTIDVTDIPDAEVGSIVTLLGSHRSVSAEALAEVAGTINYEIVTRINPLINRILTE